MKINFSDHALERMRERGATEEEVIETIEKRDCYPAKYGVCYRRIFHGKFESNGKLYHRKQVNVLATEKYDEVDVETVIVKYLMKLRRRNGYRPFDLHYLKKK